MNEKVVVSMKNNLCIAKNEVTLSKPEFFKKLYY